MSKVSKTAGSVLTEIDAFAEGRSGQAPKPALQPYVDLVNPWPFGARSIKAKIANKLVSVPIRIIRKAFTAYFAQKDYVTAITQQKLDAIDEKVGNSLLAHIDSRVIEIERLNDRLKSELMAELNKDISPLGASEKIETKIINEQAYKKFKKLNLGSGSIFKEGYVNIDHRAIEGVDVVADITDLPFESGTIEEIYLSHVVEHFTDLKMRGMLKYWYELLRPGGKIVILVPDIASMAKEYAAGNITWKSLRLVILGGQDYNSDYHFNAFSTEYMEDLVRRAVPNAQYKLIEKGRPNGECLEMEVEIHKPKA